MTNGKRKKGAPAVPRHSRLYSPYLFKHDEAFFEDEASSKIAVYEGPHNLFKNRYDGGGGTRYGLKAGGKFRTANLWNPLFSRDFAAGPYELSENEVEQIESAYQADNDAFRQYARPKYEIYAPPGAVVAKKLRLTLHFGVGLDLRRHGLRHIFGDRHAWNPDQDRVLIHISGLESFHLGPLRNKFGGFKRPWGVGISNHLIKNLLGRVGLSDKPFEVRVLSAYSTGHRGLIATIRNLGGDRSGLDITTVERVVFHDCFYDKDEPADDGPHTAKALKLLDERTGQRAEVVIYHVTAGGNQANAATLNATQNRFGDRLKYIKLDGSSGGGDGRLIVLIYARVCAEAVRDGYFPASKLSPSMQRLSKSVPTRGMVASTKPPVVPGATYYLDWYAQNRQDVDTVLKTQFMKIFREILNHEDYLLLGFHLKGVGEVAHDGHVPEFAFEHLRATKP